VRRREQELRFVGHGCRDLRAVIRLARALFAAEATRARGAKVDALAGALREVPSERVAFAARLLAGSLLPSDDARTLGAGGALVFEAACAVAGISAEELGARARRAGDLGTAVGDALESLATRDGVTPSDGGREGGRASGIELDAVAELAETLASSGSRVDKLGALERALASCAPLEARYLVRAVLGEMRVGAREGILEDAIAKAFGRPLPSVRRAAQLVADVGVLAELAREDRLAEAAMVVGRPVGFMLATPIESTGGRDKHLGAPHAVEDKLDGIRAQAHVGPGGVQLFARGRGAVTSSFPDIVGPLAAALAAARETHEEALAPAILDGEIVVVGPDGRPRPFSALQRRLGRTEPDPALLRDYPVRYVAFDLLFDDGGPLLDLPFSERRARLVRWAEAAPSPPVVLHDSRPLALLAGLAAESAIDAEYDAARARGHEGLVLKRLDAPYAAGVRGFAWLKVKKALATLDAVIVRAERGHGKRAGVLSDYTFAVRSGAELVVIGKAYSGLTDAEIRDMTARLEALATAPEQRGQLPVRPEIVLEVAFDGIQRSTRHASGFALRFPRIARVRDDKTAAQADTLDAVRALYESQLASGHREDAPAGAPARGRTRRNASAASKQLKLFDD
jgi:DNA ligase-1